MNQPDMTPNANEDLSAGLDGELSREAMRFLLRRLDHDASLQDTWTRYNVARDGLRRQLPPLASSSFASRVMLAIEQEAAPAGARRNHWLRWSAGGAIAASVAAAALMIGQPVADVDRTASTSSQRAGSHAVADVVAAPKTAIPATVPSWLSGNSAGMLSQQASATSEIFPAGSQPVYGSKRFSTYPLMHRYRTLNNDDGSYLLLLDPQQQPVSENPTRQAAAAVH
ncbi:sigma-E factor negative regulatory protein [Rhodanobacter sp. BL-MT-08]